MYSKRRYIIYVIICMVILGVFGISVLMIQKHYNEKIREAEEEIRVLSTELEAIGPMGVMYQLDMDVKAGNEANDYDLIEVAVPEAAIPEEAALPEDLEGKSYKIDLKAGFYLTKDMLLDYDLTDDMRKLDVVFNEIPIGLEVGDYIDVRISMPLGQDFCAMPHKKVVAINGSTIKLIVTEKDCYTYESMKTDLSIYSATKIYATQYVEAGIQEASIAYYPVTLEVLETLIKDPNIDTADYSDVLIRRELLETQLMNSDKVDIEEKVTRGKQNISDKFADAKKNYDQMQLDKEKEAAKAEARESTK
ncbi:hypothetical protein acsn021_06530 [Anaerocolumna cellulosilytica]|uniref:Uncharacterized protein n=1 Tax=Anaerocolumna cellulosilytica TaxID=433286 RepID=A0A6S6QR48_9FIRM|nr:hypothetical protein [Anaerocolumna cellulosilytica]MBB5197692.1 hypothetical protein [Anaerocolumna cellulosilytica]BCJ93084.1 hypothetical protein acsn021_06530 [Anaerocolumna cellulosilytica]